MYQIRLYCKATDDISIAATGSTWDELAHNFQHADFFKEDAHHDDGDATEDDPWPKQILADLKAQQTTDIHDLDYVWTLDLEVY